MEPVFFFGVTFIGRCIDLNNSYFMCLELNLADITLSLTGCQLSRALNASLLITMATPLWYRLSFLPANIIFSPVCVLTCPDPSRRHALIPRISTLYVAISLQSFRSVNPAVFPVLYTVRTFQHRTLLVFSGWVDALIRMQVSFRLSPTFLILLSIRMMESSLVRQQPADLAPW